MKIPPQFQPRVPGGRRIVVAVLGLLAFSTSLRALTGGPDSFGYTFKDSAAPSGPAYEWIDISTTGRLLLAGSGNPYGAPALVNTVALDAPFCFYGSVFESLAVSRHGYLSTDLADDGDDPSNDAPLPVTPSNGTGNRLYVLHDDLSLGSDGKVFYQYFPNSPHAHHPGGVHVFQWNQVFHTGTPGAKFNFEALLFSNGDIVFQYAAGNPEHGSGSTTGIQRTTSLPNHGLQYAANTVNSITDNLAVLIEPPAVTVTTATDEDNLILPGGTGLSLREALRSVPNGGKILFQSGLSGLTSTVSHGQFSVSGKSIMIDAVALAEPMVMNFNSASRALELVGAYVSVHNLKFERCRMFGGDGGAFWLGTGAKLSIHATEVQYAIATGSKGGVGYLGATAGVWVSDCQFSGGEAYSSGGGFYLESGATGRFFGSLFSSCNAHSSGGALYSSGGTLHVENCHFLLCDTLTGDGGALVAASTNLTVVSSYFERNTSSRYGGAMFLQANPAVEIRRCTIEGNSAPSGGGGLLANNPLAQASGTITVRSSTFSANVGASNAGDAIRVEDDENIEITHCAFADHASFAITLAESSSASVGHSFLTRNGGGLIVDTGHGAALASLGHNIGQLPASMTAAGDLITTASLTGDLADNGGPTPTYLPLAGGLLVDTGDAAISGAPSTDQRGLARIVDGNNDSSAIIDVGPVERGSVLTVTTAVDENISPGTGLSLREAVAAATGGMIIEFDASLSGQTLTLVGGSTLMLDKPLTFDGSALARNPIISADHTGGGLELPDGGSLTLVGVDIRDCPGPAVRMGAGTTFSATGCRFTGNGSSTGPSGGVVAGIWGWQTVSFVDCAVSENQSNNGGALHLTDYSSFKARDCTFSGNTAFSGGVLDCDGSQISLRRCLFNGNSATSQGGVVRNLSNDYPPFEIENCTFSGNEALNGAVFHGPWGNLSLRHCTVYGNYTLDGEAIELTGTNPDSFVISHSVFASNRTGTVGYRNFSGPAPTSTDHNIEDVHDFAFAGPGDRSNTQPLLGPLTWNGGTQRAHAPLALSPLIDAGSNGANTPSQDARGRTRNDDGDGDGLAAPDIGAYESGTPVVVTNIADENDNLPPYSLRDALVAVEAGGRILFDRSLNGGVIKLAASQGGLGTTLEIPRNVMIDATSLPNGVAISGNDSVRLFRISTNYDVSFHALTLRQGFGSTAGGALRNLGGNVTFNLCCLHDNTSSLRGGAIYCAGGSLLMENCTLANNESANQGGAVADDSASPTGFRFAHCTVAGNVSASGGGGIDLDSSPAEFLYTILSGNTNGSGARNLTLAGAAAVTSLGYNLESGTEAGFTATGDIQNGNAALGALANNGGFALTCALGTGSQAVDVSQFDAPPVPRTDGRGFNRYSYFNPGNTAARFIDIGAYEKNGDTYDTDADGLPDWWEAQCGLDLANAADAALDADSDGATALEEYQAETDPLDSGSVLQLTAFTFDTATGVAHLTWPVLPGRTYELWRTSDLATWTFFGNVNAPVGSTVLTRTISGFNPATLPRQFFRIQTQR